MSEIAKLKFRHWGWRVIFGIIMMLLGITLLGAPVIATLATVFLFGSLLVAGGVIHGVAAFFEKGSSHFWLHLVLAALAVVVGFLMLMHPGVTLLTLTLLMGAFFLSGGLFRIIAIFITRFSGWGWYLLSAIISLLLGCLIIFQWPSSSLWVIGVFMGIDFLFAGLSLLMTGLFIKQHGFVAT